MLWIAMELVRGTPLSEVLKAQGAMPLERFVPLFDRICDVVHTAHEAGIVHRDLKPANVMVIARAGKLLPKLLDFGIAKATGETGVSLEGISGEDESPPASVELTQEGQVIGSPLYMAPEQWVDPARLADARSDQYALAILAYECLHGCGKVPFRAADRTALARAHMKRAFPGVGEGLPERLNPVFARALAKKQVDRYESVIELAAGFRAASGVGIEKENLPRLDDTLRNELGDAPQPIADAVVAFDAARNAFQARDALWEIVHVVLRYLGALALASRTRVGVGGDADSATVMDGLRALRQRDVDDTGWLQLVRGLTRPFVDKPDAYPIPELVGFLHGTTGPLERLLAMRVAEAGAMTMDEQVRDGLNRALPEVAALLRQAGFLADYVLCVPRGDGAAEKWVGPRRVKRMSMAVVGDAGPAGRPVLLDRDGRPVLSVWPLLQVEPPTPGISPELFLFEGRGRRGARLVAAPIGFERQDEPIWDWFRDKLLVGGEGETTQAVEERAPYLGLASFRTEDASNFFGRERQAEAFVNRLKVQPLLAVVGPSGAGKSSFVQAGVVPLLGDEWTVLAVRPGPTPLAALRAKLGPGDLAEALRSQETPKTLLVVDQFEELFTLCHDPDERTAYAQMLVGAAVSADEPIRIVLTLRDDFLVRAEHERALRDRLAQGLQLLSTPSTDDLHRIVTEPAKRAGYTFDDAELPSQMVAAVADQPGALALLSFTASKLWELRDRHFKQLTRKAHDALGGVGGALAQHAESTLGGMPQDEQRQVREAFRHLVTADGTRAVLGRDELVQLLRGGEVVLEKLIQARLLTASEDGKIEVIHEALLSAWPRLADWRREDAEGARLRDQLRAAARQWDERSRPRGLLWRDEALDEYRRWRTKYTGGLTDAEEAFGAASVRDALRGQRIKRGLQVAGVVILVGIVIGQLWNNSVIAEKSRLAEENAITAAKNADEATNRLLSSYEEQARQYWLAGDAPRAAAFLEAAHSRGRDTPTMRYLASRIIDVMGAELARFPHPGVVVAAELRDDVVFTGTHDGTVSRWSLGGGKARWSTRGHDPALIGLAASVDGKILASSGFEGLVRLYDPETGSIVRELAHEGSVTALAVSPDGALIASGTDSGVITVWDAVTGKSVAHTTGHAAGLTELWFNATGSELLSAGADGRACVWTTPNLGMRLRLQISESGRLSARFGTAGRIVVASGSEARIYDRQHGAPLVTVGHTRPILAFAESADGARLATGSEDGTVRVWATPRGTLEQVLADHVGAVRGVAFSPSNARLVSVGRDGGARVWDPETGKLLARYAAHTDGILKGFWVDDDRFLTLGRDRRAKLWRVAERFSDVWTLEGPAVWLTLSPGQKTLLVTREAVVDPKTHVVTGEPGIDLFDIETKTRLHSLPLASRVSRFSPDGKYIAIAREDGGIELRDAASMRRLWGVRPHEKTAVCVGFDSKGERLVTTGWDGVATILHVENGRLERRFEIGSETISGQFSPDDRWVLFSSADGKARVFEASTGRDGPVVEHPTGLQSAEYDHRGSRIITSSRDTTARIWDAASGKLLESLTGHTNEVGYATFSFDDRYVITDSNDGTSRVWEASTGRLLDTLRAHHGEVLAHSVSVDGRLLFTTGADARVARFDFVRAEDLEQFARRTKCWSAFEVNASGSLLPRAANCEL